LKNSKGKTKTFSINKTNKWKENLNELFDIAHANANDLITVEEDRVFMVTKGRSKRLNYGS
jgi:hypothetical protein